MWTDSDTLRALQPNLELHPFLPIVGLRPCEEPDQAQEALRRLQQLLACLCLSRAGCEVLTYLALTYSPRTRVIGPSGGAGPALPARRETRPGSCPILPYRR